MLEGKSFTAPRERNPVWEAAMLGDVAACKLAKKTGNPLDEPDEVLSHRSPPTPELTAGCAVRQLRAAPRRDTQASYCNDWGYWGTVLRSPGVFRWCTTCSPARQPTLAAQTWCATTKRADSCINAVWQLGNTPLHLAAGSGDAVSVEVSTHAACGAPTTTVPQYLLAAKADPGAQNMVPTLQRASRLLIVWVPCSEGRLRSTWQQ